MLLDVLDGVAFAHIVGYGLGHNVTRGDDQHPFSVNGCDTLSRRTCITVPFCSLSFMLINSFSCFIISVSDRGWYCIYPELVPQ